MSIVRKALVLPHLPKLPRQQATLWLIPARAILLLLTEMGNTAWQGEFMVTTHAGWINNGTTAIYVKTNTFSDKYLDQPYVTVEIKVPQGSGNLFPRAFYSGYLGCPFWLLSQLPEKTRSRRGHIDSTSMEPTRVLHFYNEFQENNKFFFRLRFLVRNNTYAGI